MEGGGASVGAEQSDGTVGGGKIRGANGGGKEESDPSTSGSYRNCDSRPARSPIKKPRRALSIRRQRSKATVVTLRGRGRKCQPDGRVVGSLKYRLLTLPRLRGGSSATEILFEPKDGPLMSAIKELISRHSSLLETLRVLATNKGAS